MLPVAQRIPDVRKIAVLRANGIGDFVFALPALEALRAAYPEAEIVLLGKAWHEGFLAGRPGPVDRVVVVPPCQGITGEDDDPRAMASFFADMEREEFDLALQIHGGGRHSNPFVCRLGARVTAGLRTADADPLDRWTPYVYFQPESVRFLEAVALVGAAPVSLEPRLAVTTADLDEAQQVVPDDGRPLAALHPGAGYTGRRWPAEKFAAVGDVLAANGARAVVTGSTEESHLTAAVMAGMTAPAEDLTGRLSLNGLVGLLSRCAVVVANDSGPLHLAAAAGAPTVGIYWCFNLATAAPLTRGRHRPVVSWQVTCPRCGADRARSPCDHGDSFVAGIPVEEVARAALDLFNGPGRSCEEG